MKVVVFVLSLALFLGSFLAFGYSFTVVDGWNYVLFVAGLVGITLALVIPFHILSGLD